MYGGARTRKSRGYIAGVNFHLGDPLSGQDCRKSTEEEKEDKVLK